MRFILLQNDSSVQPAAFQLLSNPPSTQTTPESPFFGGLHIADTLSIWTVWARLDTLMPLARPRSVRIMSITQVHISLFPYAIRLMLILKSQLPREFEGRNGSTHSLTIAPSHVSKMPKG